MQIPGDKNVVVSGNHAFVASGSGLRIVDVFNPAAPVAISSLDTPGFTWDIAVSGGLAFVADGRPDVRTIDVSTPARPLEVRFLDTSEADSIFVSRSVVCIADGNNGL